MEEKYIPKIYLDQNALEDFAKRGVQISGVEDYFLIYSGATIEELKRVEKKFLEPFLGFLEEKGAIYIWIQDLEPKWTDRNPREIFEEQVSEEEKNELVLESMKVLNQKMFGGKGEFSFEEIATMQKEALIQLFESLTEELDSKEIEKAGVDMDKLIKSTGEFFDKFGEILSVSGEENFSLKKMRLDLNLNPQEINNFSSSEIFEKVVSKYGDTFGFGKGNVSPKFKEWSIWATMNDSNPSIYKAVSHLYTVLNMVGYWADKNLVKDRTFNSAFNDSQHVMYAINADYLLTRDKRMAKKAKAIYEFFGLRTQVVFYEIDISKS